jgi:hypothetical protein
MHSDDSTRVSYSSSLNDKCLDKVEALHWFPILPAKHPSNDPYCTRVAAKRFRQERERSEADKIIVMGNPDGFAVIYRSIYTMQRILVLDAKRVALG